MHHEERGFTLVEAMAAVAVLAITTTVAVPAMRDFIQQYRATSAMQRFGTQFASARLAAATHGRRTTVCPLATSGTCAEDGDWSRGSIAFFDADGDRRPDSDGDILHIDEVSTGSRLLIRSSAGRRYLRFLPDGRSPGRNLSIHFCDPELGRVGSLVVNNAGRTRTEKPAAPAPCPL